MFFESQKLYFFFVQCSTGPSDPRGLWDPVDPRGVWGPRPQGPRQGPWRTPEVSGVRRTLKLTGWERHQSFKDFINFSLPCLSARRAENVFD